MLGGDEVSIGGVRSRWSFEIFFCFDLKMVGENVWFLLLIFILGLIYRFLVWEVSFWLIVVFEGFVRI